MAHNAHALFLQNSNVALSQYCSVYECISYEEGYYTGAIGYIEGWNYQDRGRIVLWL